MAIKKDWTLRKKLQDPVYKSYVLLWVGGNPNNVDTWLSDRGFHVPPTEPDTIAFVAGAHRVYVIYFNKSPRPEIIAHECLHLASNIMRDVGMETNRFTEEAQAYLLQYFYEQIAEVL